MNVRPVTRQATTLVHFPYAPTCDNSPRLEGRDHLRSPHLEPDRDVSFDFYFMPRSTGSLYDAEAHVDRLGGVDYFESFKRNVLAVQALEQACAVAEQHGDEVDRDFINQAAF